MLKASSICSAQPDTVSNKVSNMKFTACLFAGALLFSTMPVAYGQDLGAALKDPKLPQRIKPQDLGADMYAIKITYEKQGGGNDFFSMLMNPMMAMLGAFSTMSTGGAESKPAEPDQAAALAFFDKLGTSWTNGSTVKMYGQEFLVTYSAQINLAEIRNSSAPPDLSKMDLTLMLINTKSIVSIAPQPQLTKEEWLKPPAPIPPSPESARTTAMSRMKQLALSAIMYSADYDDVIPYVQSSKGAFEVLEPYSRNREITQSANPNGGRILLNMAIAGVTMTSIERPAETVLFYDEKAWPNGQYLVGYTDGHVKFLDESEWAVAKNTLTLKLPKVGKALPSTLGQGWPGT
jgi:hypothetical protein